MPEWRETAPLDSPPNNATHLDMQQEIKRKRVEILTTFSEHKQWIDQVRARKFSSIGEFIRAAVRSFLSVSGNITSTVKSYFTPNPKLRDHYQAVAINRIGNNVNQIARALNSALAHDDPINVAAADIKLGCILMLTLELYHIAQRIDSCNADGSAEMDILILHYLRAHPEERNEIIAAIKSQEEQA